MALTGGMHYTQVTNFLDDLDLEHLCVDKLKQELGNLKVEDMPLLYDMIYELDAIPLVEEQISWIRSVIQFISLSKSGVEPW